MQNISPVGDLKRFQCVVAVLLLVLAGLSGCGSDQQQKPLAPVRVTVQPYQRFVPIAHGQGYLSFPYWAFDTKTGQLCKTWDWQFHDAATKNAAQSADSSALTGMDAAAYGTQTCKQLWTAYPDGSK